MGLRMDAPVPGAVPNSNNIRHKLPSTEFTFNTPSTDKENSERRRSSAGGNGHMNGSNNPSGRGGGSGGQTKEEMDLAEAEAKKRKVQRACDVCRRKKIRCEGPMSSHSASKCANCEEYGFDCTYVEAAKRRGPPKGYVEALEQRCGRLERLLQQLHPGTDFISNVGPMPDKDEFDLQEYSETLKTLGIPAYPSMKPFHLTGDGSKSHSHSATSCSPISPPAASAPSPSMQILGPTPWKSFEQDPNRPPEDPQDEMDEVSLNVRISESMNKLDIRGQPWRFHGKASPHHLFLMFNELRRNKDSHNFMEALSQTKRPQYWQVPEWEVVIANEGLRPIDYSVWPDDDFAELLIDTYFEFTNTELPLLNRLLFKRQYKAGLYKQHHAFAKVCLLVFANASRFVDDERVYWPVDDALTEEGKERLRTDTDGTLRYSAGWAYVREVVKMGKSIMQGPNLFDFQVMVLMCCFLHGSAVPHLTWLLSGAGLRSAQEIGIHIRSILIHADPVERALYNRAFWCLYHLDRLNCAAIGRSVALQDTDFDADYPIAVDDEYWDTGDPETDFKQPPDAGVPRVAAFIHTLKLDHIIGAALRTIYAINKLPEHRSDPAGQRAVVVELDSALNCWADSVPDGLRWDPTRSDQKLFLQSAQLYSYYYYCQILVHRPFIPTPKHPNTVGLPSLAICTNASRSICNILDAVLRRGRQHGTLPGHAMPVYFMLPAWIAFAILLISLYSGRQQTSERERAMTDVKRCIAAMKEMEVLWRQAGKLTDFMSEMFRESEIPNDQAPWGQKRTHETPKGLSPLSQVTPPPTYTSGPSSTERLAASTNPCDPTIDSRSSYERAPPPPGITPGTSVMPPVNYSDRPAVPGPSPWIPAPPAAGVTTGAPLYGIPGTLSGVFPGVVSGAPPMPATADTTNPVFSGVMEGLFDNAMFDTFYGSLGELTGFEVPPGTAGGQEDDLWSQLFGSAPVMGDGYVNGGMPVLGDPSAAQGPGWDGAVRQPQ